MNLKLANGWMNILQPEMDKTYFKELINFIDLEYKNHECFPQKKHIFEAFNLCDLDNLKVVIIGQDPYHDVNQAHGLCFSVNEGIAHPPSLKNIFKEIESDLEIPYPNSGNLERWAKQGVLLLNAILTVKAHNAGSHQKKGWEKFTDAAIAALNTEQENLVFLLWGSYAQKKGALIDRQRHCVLSSVHPSPLSAYRGFLGCRHFSKTNEYLQSVGKETIDWSIAHPAG